MPAACVYFAHAVHRFACRGRVSPASPPPPLLSRRLLVCRVCAVCVVVRKHAPRATSERDTGAMIARPFSNVQQLCRRFRRRRRRVRCFVDRSNAHRDRRRRRGGVRRTHSAKTLVARVRLTLIVISVCACVCVCFARLMWNYAASGWRIPQ